uniref:Transmembrane protein 256 homolog n=1 Tax=Angiostrongylus cantonensis TaxID=6313 RepID=A0A0K0D3Q3_ANGCA
MNSREECPEITRDLSSTIFDSERLFFLEFSEVIDDMTIDVRRKKAFETGSLFHIVHTLAILAAPRARYPYLTSAVFLSGIIMFCGPCYHYSITGQKSTRKFTPIGGVMFILGWITFIL